MQCPRMPTTYQPWRYHAVVRLVQTGHTHEYVASAEGKSIRTIVRIMSRVGTGGAVAAVPALLQLPQGLRKQPAANRKLSPVLLALDSTSPIHSSHSQCTFCPIRRSSLAGRAQQTGACPLSWFTFPAATPRSIDWRERSSKGRKRHTAQPSQPAAQPLRRCTPAYSGAPVAAAARLVQQLQLPLP